MKKTLQTLWILFVTVGLVFPNFYGFIIDTISGPKFGDGGTYPTSLPSYTTINGTDSVATVSHSQRHNWVQLDITALATKQGLTASTPVTNTILAGNGSGTSLWTTYGTTTNFTINSLGTFGSFISLASSTVIGNLNITGNSTSTNATSTIGAFTSYATSTGYYGAGLSTCIGSNYLIWTGGQFGCTSLTTAQRPLVGIASSTNSSYLASTTNLVEGQSIVWRAICQRNTAGSDLVMGYRLANEAVGATTTIMNFGTSGDELEVGEGVFYATTTVTITVQAAAANTCDEGMQLTTIFHR